MNERISLPDSAKYRGKCIPLLIKSSFQIPPYSFDLELKGNVFNSSYNENFLNKGSFFVEKKFS